MDEPEVNGVHVPVKIRYQLKQGHKKKQSIEVYVIYYYRVISKSA